jgi:hypothetical protein
VATHCSVSVEAFGIVTTKRFNGYEFVEGLEAVRSHEFHT